MRPLTDSKGSYVLCYRTLKHKKGKQVKRSHIKLKLWFLVLSMFIVEEIMHNCVSSITSANYFWMYSNSSLTKDVVERIPEWWTDCRVSASFDWLSSLISRSDAVQHLSQEIVTRRQGKGSDYSGPDGHLPEIEE